MFNRNSFKKRILFVGIPDMAYIGLDGLLMAGVNIVGVLGPKKDHSMYFDFKNFVLSRGLNYIEYDELDDEITSIDDEIYQLDSLIEDLANLKLNDYALEDFDKDLNDETIKKYL